MENISNSTENSSDNYDTVLELASEVVAAYVGNNSVSTTDLPILIGDVYDALTKASKNRTMGDGKKFKSLKRHLRSHYDISPEEYREKWGLPLDYPMVAPNYAKARSQLARDMGLGRKPGQKIKKKN